MRVSLRVYTRSLPSELILFVGRGSKKGKFDGLLEEPKKGLFLLFFAPDPFALVAAERAQFEDLSPASAQPMHAVVAENLTAMRALMRCLRLGVPPTKHRTVPKHDGRSRLRKLEFWNTYFHFSGDDKEFDVPQPERLTFGEGCSGDGFVSHEGAIGGIAVPHHDLIFGQSNLTMLARHSGMFDLEIVGRAPAHFVNPKPELNYVIMKPL